MYARRQTRPKPRKSEVRSLPAPIGGWISNRALASPQQVGERPGAAILDDFFPLATTVTLRRGKLGYVTLGDGSLDCTSIFAYVSGASEKLFAATPEAIFDITNPEAVTESVSSLSGGHWNVVQYAATGGDYLVGVNGEDAGILYDGSTFSTLGVTFAGTALTPADMTYVWVYKNRLWFAEKGAMRAWYLPVDAIAGEASPFPLVGVFSRGGVLLFGETWSLDAGAEGGLSEQVIFVSTEGEVAVYQGSDPDEATTWSKVGLYRIGRPLGDRAWLRGGGDIAIATDVGLVPMSKAIALDVTALSTATISYNIMDAWQEAVGRRGNSGWQCTLYPNAKMAVVALPNIVGGAEPVVFVSNTETGAWARFRGWQGLALCVFGDELYFGSPGGKVFIANRGGLDDGEPYTAVCMPLFDDFGSPASAKVAKVGRVVLRARAAVNDRTEFRTDFDMHLDAPPGANQVPGNSLWGSGTWGEAVWGGMDSRIVQQDWRSIAGVGYACSLATQITSGALAPLDAEIIRFDLTYTTAEIVT